MKNYYEIEFAKLEQLNDDYITTPDRMFICIIAEFEPSFEDVEEFCKEDMKNCGYDCVVDVHELSYEEAHQMYDLRNELNFPVLKQKNFETANNNIIFKFDNDKEYDEKDCKFALVSNDLTMFRKGEIEDLMYDIQGNISLIKNIVAHKISKKFNNFLFDVADIKKLQIYVVKQDEFTEIWLDFDKNNDLCFIAKSKYLKIDDVYTITNIVANWLLSE